MLTAYQHSLIDALPDEGVPSFKDATGTTIAYQEHELTEATNLPLRDKIVRLHKRAIILHGAPGSGKSFAGLQRLQAMAEKDPRIAREFPIISYDEAGAIYDIQEYCIGLQKIAPDMRGQDVPVDPHTLEARRKLWLQFQPLSQRIRSQSFKTALRQEHSVYIDTTSSSAGTLKLIDLLRDLDYSHIEFWSYHSPLTLAASRIEGRARPTSIDDLLLKRIGAYEMLPQIVKAADLVSLNVNDSDFNPPAEFAVFQCGEFVRGAKDISQSLVARLDYDADEFYNLCMMQYGADRSREYVQKYQGAVASFETVMEPLHLSSDHQMFFAPLQWEPKF